MRCVVFAAMTGTLFVTGLQASWAAAQPDQRTMTATIRDFRGAFDISGNPNPDGHPDFEQFDFRPDGFGKPDVAISALPPFYTITFKDRFPKEYFPPTINPHDIDPSYPNLDISTGGNDQTRKVEPGIVESTLGLDRNPVYKGQSNPGFYKSTHDAARFNQWYNDTTDVNLSHDIDLTLVDNDSDGIFTLSDQTFFPLDNPAVIAGDIGGADTGGFTGYGNEGRDHNYSFTMELHDTPVYNGGETFRFVGDDDVFLFINGQLVMDLGGVHNPLPEGSPFVVNLDDLGLTKGQAFDFDFFYAERNTSKSTILMETSILLGEGGGTPPPPPPPPPPPAIPLPAAAWMALSALGGLGVVSKLRRRLS
ncbi:MAG: fibro-slime domain-containing protein [Phycisphaerales bacterium]|nr:fibro-slime domain-containing protein [Phycisphaerales bacterium]